MSPRTLMPLLMVFGAIIGGILSAATSASCAHVEAPAPPNPADNVECYWSTHHGLCLCSGNWHDQSPHLVLTPAKNAKACL